MRTKQNNLNYLQFKTAMVDAGNTSAETGGVIGLGSIKDNDVLEICLAYLP